MPARKRGTINLAAAIGDEVAEHQQDPRPVPPVAAVPQAPAAEPEPPEPESLVTEVPRPGRRATPQPAEPKEPTWDARMSLTLRRDMKRALDIARADDGIEGTARIRAMIALWQQDDRLRRRIDREALNYR
jgi:hypothetical protein